MKYNVYRIISNTKAVTRLPVVTGIYADSYASYTRNNMGIDSTHIVFYNKKETGWFFNKQVEEVPIATFLLIGDFSVEQDSL